MSLPGVSITSCVLPARLPRPQHLPRIRHSITLLLLLLLLSCFSRVRLLATPWTAAHQAPRPWAFPGKSTGVGCHFLLQCMKVESEVKSLSRVRLLATPWTAAHQAPRPRDFPGKSAQTRATRRLYLPSNGESQRLRGAESCRSHTRKG